MVSYRAHGGEEKGKDNTEGSEGKEGREIGNRFAGENSPKVHSFAMVVSTTLWYIETPPCLRNSEKREESWSQPPVQEEMTAAQKWQVKTLSTPHGQPIATILLENLFFEEVLKCQPGEHKDIK